MHFYQIGPETTNYDTAAFYYNKSGWFQTSISGAGAYTRSLIHHSLMKDRWYHIVVVKKTNAQDDIYLNSQKLGGLYTSGTQLNLPQNTSIILGHRPADAGVDPLDGSIANFRLFNRALTEDEVWQLYAYQKEYFGHGNLGMTLKSGRLGIGTSEPRAVLDVRGTIRSKRPMWSAGFNPTGNVTLPSLTSTTGIVFENLNYDHTSDYNTSTGYFTAPVSGYYFIGTRALLYVPTGETRIDVDITKANVNGSKIRVIQGERMAGSEGGRATNNNMTCQISGTVYLAEGEQVYPRYKQSGTNTYIVSIANDFNEFWGFLIEQV